MMIQQLGLFGNQEIINPNEIARKYLVSTKGIGTPSITSISGGRSSAWMAINYPTDYYVFALVTTHHSSHIPDDKGLIREIKKKCPEFVASLELPETLKCVLELEQKLSKEITWVWGDTFENVVFNKKGGYLPNRFTRFCTTELKYIPIFDWVQSNFPGSIIEMNLGFRADEPKRVYKMVGGKNINNKWDFTELGKCESHPKSRKKIEWRFKQAPMFLDGITKPVIHSDRFIKSLPFPEVSNCSHCPFHTSKEHISQYKKNPEYSKFWIDLENMTGNTFLNGISLFNILNGNDYPSLDFDSCDCTD